MPKVSVLIPAYNAEQYVAETIQSVLAQTWRDYEIIAVDDGSTDGTLAVLQSFEPRIKVLTKANGGPASARNMALTRAQGEYLAFLDADDLWLANKLEVQTPWLEQQPSLGLIYSEAIMFSVSNGVRKLQETIGYTGDASFRLLLYGDFIPNSTVVIRRACVDKIGLLNERRDLIAGEDYEYWLRLAKHYPLAGVAQPLAYYRLHQGNLLGQGQDIEKALQLSFNVLQEIEKQFPDIWEEYEVNRAQLFARLCIRAGFAWKKQHNWKACLHKYRQALSYSTNPLVFRWLAAATLLERWS